MVIFHDLNYHRVPAIEFIAFFLGLLHIGDRQVVMAVSIYQITWMIWGTPVLDMLGNIQLVKYPPDDYKSTNEDSPCDTI